MGNTSTAIDGNSNQIDCSFLFDTDISQFTPSAITALGDHTFLSLTLHGVRAAFNRVLQLPQPPEIVFDERVKDLLLNRTNSTLQYPYAYIMVNDMDIVRDQSNVTAIQKQGMLLRNGPGRQRQGTSVPKMFMFPLAASITLTIMDSDAKRLFSLCQAVLLADVFRALNFTINAYNSDSKVVLKKQGAISIPESVISSSDEADFNASKVTVNFELHGWVGFNTYVPAVSKIIVRLNSQDATGENTILFDTIEIDIPPEGAST